MSEQLKLLDTFAGIGGFSYAAETLVGGFETVGFIEREPFCQKILSQHWPNVPIYDDITTFKGTPGFADVITGGFPCQDLSVAGHQRGLSGARSGLFYELMRVVREVQPAFFLFENVANLKSHQNGQTFQEVLREIAASGYDAEWACIPAKELGACHKRDRIWIVGIANSHPSIASDSYKHAAHAIEQALVQEWDGEHLRVRVSGSPCSELVREKELAYAASKSRNGSEFDGSKPNISRPETVREGTTRDSDRTTPQGNSAGQITYPSRKFVYGSGSDSALNAERIGTSSESECSGGEGSANAESSLGTDNRTERIEGEDGQRNGGQVPPGAVSGPDGAVCSPDTDSGSPQLQRGSGSILQSSTEEWDGVSSTGSSGEAVTERVYWRHIKGTELSGERVDSAWPELWSDPDIFYLNNDWTGYLSQPVLCRGDDGLRDRVDRLKALGNAIVPHVAQPALKRIQHLARLSDKCKEM